MCIKALFSSLLGKGLFLFVKEEDVNEKYNKLKLLFALTRKRMISSFRGFINFE